MKNEEIYKICERKLQYLNYSPRTADLYLHYIRQFLDKMDVNIQRVNSSDFQRYLDNYKFTSISQQNQVINAVRFLYKFGLNKKYDKVSFNRPKKEKKLPRVIDQDLLRNKLEQIPNLKHRAILTLAFSVGLRVSEVVNLKIADIDSNRMIIHIKNAKGRKDRIVPLSDKVLDLLRKYFTQYKPKEYLFNGQDSLQYSTRSCNEIFKKHIDTSGHFHLLRHSSFTAMLESGTDIRIIQKVAGHNSIKTTSIYAHVSNAVLRHVKTPV
jgi:integrase/recombinase XerD